MEGIFIPRHEDAIALYADVATLYVRASEPRGDAPGVYISSENGRTAIRVVYPVAPSLPLLGKIVDFFRYIAAARRGLECLRERWGAPEVILTHVNPPLGLMYMIWRRFQGVPLIHVEHWSGYLEANGAYGRSGWGRRFFTRRFIARADYTCTVSADLQRAMESSGLKGRYHVIANVVNTELFCPAPSAAGGSARFRPEVFHILHVSGLKALKNVDGIMRVITRLMAQGRGVCLHVAGDGGERGRLETMARELGLPESAIIFYGFLPPPEVAKLMQKAHIFVLFSDYENSPCVLAEAAASGIPCVATAVGGVPELISTDNGRLVPARDEYALETALTEMMEHYDMFDPLHIREEAIRRFSLPSVGKRFLEMVDRALLERGAGGKTGNRSDLNASVETMGRGRA